MDSEELRVLIAVARTGSFHSAALSLGLSRSTLRRRVESLEAWIGAALVRSSPQGAMLTSTGERVVRHGMVVLREIETMLGRIRIEGEQLIGELRLGLPPGFPPGLHARFLSIAREALPRLRWRFPRIDLGEPSWTDKVDALMDLSGVAVPPGWVSYELLKLEETLVASPRYLDAHGTPTRVEDLIEHELLMWLIPDRDVNHLPAAKGTHLAITPAIVDAGVHPLYVCADMGMGIAFVPYNDFVAHTASFNLVKVLPEVVVRPCKLRLLVSEPIAQLDLFARFLNLTQAQVSNLDRA